LLGSALLYSDVNDALNQVLLSERNAGRPVYLILDNTKRRNLAERLALQEEEVEDEVCRVVGRTLHKSGDPYWRHAEDLRNWTAGGAASPPPCTGLLFVLSHAAELMHSDGQVSHTNYYLRLSQVTGVEGGHLTAHGKETLKFWQAFSGWLSANDYAYGRPTTRQIGMLKYVSLPMSQAIVRAEDRGCFHDLFEKYGFTSADEVGREEMAQYISSWVFGGAASRRIKAAWSKPELRDHVSEIAVSELEEWASLDGADDHRDGAASGGARLSLIASIIPSFPKRRLSLGLGRKWEGEEGIELVSKEDGARFTLANVLHGAFATLSLGPGLIENVLVRGISLSSPGGGRDQAWRPRMVVPLARSSSGAFWVEVTRTVLGTEHMVLARDIKRIREAVETVLAEAAAPGYTRAVAEQVPGIPQGWALYQGVKLVRALNDPPNDATDLSPIGDAAGVRAENGMMLLPGVWHRQAPPVVRLDTAGTGGKLELLDGEGEDPVPIATSEAQGGLAQIDLGSVDLGGRSSLRARAKVGKRPELSLPLLLRTAEIPQPLDRTGKGTLVSNSLYTASDAGQSKEGLACEGLASPLQASRLVPVSGITRHPAIGLEVEGNAGWIEAQTPVTEPPAPPFQQAQGSGLEEQLRLTCGQRGFHYFIVETVPPGAPPSTPVAMKCKDCGYSALRKARVSRQQRTTPLPAVPPPAPTEDQSGGPPGRFDMDLVLDALCFLGNGPASRLEGLVAREVEQPWEVLAMAEGLSALGHLELKRQTGSGRLLAWSVAAPVASMASDGEGFLAGFRNDRLIAEVSGRLAAAGGRLLEEELPGQPRRLRITGLSHGEVASALAGCTDPHGRPVKVIEDTPGSLASTCLAMAGDWRIERTATLGSPADLEAYDPLSNKWRKAGANGAGAFRTRSAGTVYFHRDRAGNVIQAPHFLVKLMSAREQGLRLHGYDQGSGHFVSVMGCEPPGLLARALCAATGKLPSGSDGRSWYPGVAPAVAATILDVLYPEGTPQ